MTGAESLAVSGGWGGANGSCTSQDRDPAATTLFSAAGTTRLLKVYLAAGASGTFSLSHMELNGHEFSETNGEPGSCLQVTSSGANIVKLHIERMQFRTCRALQYGAADITTGGGKVYFLGNMVVGNISYSGSGVRIDAPGNDVYINNNTITANFGGANQVCGLRLMGAAFFFVSNNILWGNDGIADIAVTANTLLLSNIIGDVSGIPNGLWADNPSVSPKFANGIGYRLSAQSPARNSGANSPYGGAPAFDFYRDARTQEGTIDRGAVEFEASMFRNGFD